MSELHQNENLAATLPPAAGLLGLLPSIAVATTLVKGVSIGIIVALIFLGTSLICSLLRHRIAESWRIPFLLTVSAMLTTLLQMNLAAFLFAVYAALGFFVSLIAVNGLIFTRGLSVAFTQSIAVTVRDAIKLGAVIVFVLTLFGGLRELVTYGSLFSGAEKLFGAGAKNWLWHPLPKNYSFILAGLAPGALIILGMLYALKNLIRRGSPADMPVDLR